jgi:hypothetical protein
MFSPTSGARSARRVQRLGWPALSRSFHLNSQVQTGASNLVLECKPHELGFVLTKRLSKAGGSLRADSSSALLDIAEVRP